MIPVNRPVTALEGFELSTATDRYLPDAEIPVPDVDEDALYGARSSRWEVAAVVRSCERHVTHVDAYERELASIADSIARQERAWEAAQ